MEAVELLGLDVGIKRTGIARGSSLAKIAQPLLSVPTDDILVSLRTLVDENGVGAIVVGLPRNLSGDDSLQTAWVRQWVKNAKKKIKLPFYWQDEALTSVKAQSHAYRQVAIMSGSKTKDVDSLAATVILQDFLDIPESERILV